MDYGNEIEEIKVILADDHEVVRAGIKRLLNVDKSIKILAEACNGEEAVQIVRQYQPDIAILDIQMPKMNGIQATQQIKKEFPDVFVVILTAFEDSTHIEQALSAGADGYLSKDIGVKNLTESLHNVIKGERVFSKSILKLLQHQVPNSTEDAEPVSISPREQEILNLVALGKTSLEISDILIISIRTVQAHRSNIMQKLDIKTAGGLVRYAVLNAKYSSKEEAPISQH